MFRLGSLILIILSSFSLSASVVRAQDLPQNSENPPAKTEELPAEVDKSLTYLLCKNKKLVRTVRVEKIASGGCRTKYTKDGSDQNVGESQSVQICLKVLRNIRINLEKADWKCKDISESRVSFSEQ